MESPKTLQEAIQIFSDFDNCRQFMAALRWPDGVVRCPRCDSDKVVYIDKPACTGVRAITRSRSSRSRWARYSRILRLPLEKWLPAAWMLVNDKNGISSWELHRALKVTQKTAWFMLHRIRAAMKDGGFEQSPKLGGEGGGRSK